jgi:DNA-binding NarL/FixJ family response regulator
MPARTGSSVKRRVLLMPWDTTFERDMVAALRSENCEVFSAADSCQPLAIARACSIHLLVLDLAIDPHLVYQLWSQLNAVTRRFRTLALADSLEQLSRASETLVDGILVKRLEPNQVRTAVHNLLAGGQIRAPIERTRPDRADLSATPRSKCDRETNL